MEEKSFEVINKKLSNIEYYSRLAAIIIKNVFNLEETSFYTGIPKSTLYQLTCKHEIPHYKPRGKQIYFDRAEIEAWMKQNKISTIKEIDQQATSYVVTGRMQKGGSK